MNKTVLDFLANSASKYPDFKVLYDKTSGTWQGLTLAQVENLTNYIAAGLLSNGFKPGQKFGLLSEGRNFWVLAEFGLLKIKAQSVPLSVKLLPEEILFRLNHSEASAIFVSSNYLEKVLKIINQLENPDFKLILFDNDQRTNQLLTKYNIPNDKFIFFEKLIEQGRNSFDALKPQLEQIRQQISEDDVILTIYTSGTTGDPKGVMLTHKNFWYNTKEAYEHFKDLPQFSKTLAILPIDHSFAHTAQVYTSIMIPLALYFLDSRGGAMNALRNIPVNLKEVQPYFLLTVPALTGNFMNKILENIRKQNAIIRALFNLGIKAGIKKNGNAWTRPNALLRLIYSLPHGIADILIFKKIRKSLGNFRFTISGGAYLDLYQQQFFAALGIPIYQGYGLSENSPIISTNTPYMWKMGTTGRPLPSVKVKIIRDGQELGPNEKGEIVVSGPCVMKGYYKNPKATAEAIRDGWLYTGDLGYLDQDGFLVVVGREKALLISQDGEKYSPEEIEETIKSYSPFVSQIMLYNEHFPYTVAIVVLDEDYVKNYIKQANIQDAQQLLEAIQQSLTNFKRDKNLKNKFPTRWLPATFAIAPEPFSEQNKQLNSTMKMVRHNIVKAYKNLIDIMAKDTSKKQITRYNLDVLNEKFFNQHKTN